MTAPRGLKNCWPTRGTPIGAGINRTFNNLRRGSEALTAAGIDRAAVATSSFRITWMIDRARVLEAVRVLHQNMIAPDTLSTPKDTVDPKERL